MSDPTHIPDAAGSSRGTADPAEAVVANTPVGRGDAIVHGTILAVVSSFCYTFSIISLRAVTDEGADWAAWVSCLKAIPTVATALVIILLRRRTIVWPSRRMIVTLLVSGTAMQLLGNVGFQWGLALGGMAFTVPISQASLLVSGAMLGVVWIGERVSRRSVAAMAVLITAIGLLSIDADQFAAGVGVDTSGLGSAILLTIAAGLVAGIGWGQSGVVIRQAAKSGVSTSAIILLLSSTALVVLGGGVLVRQGTAWIAERTSSYELWMSLLAGAFTSLAFFALTAALKHISIVRANIINASQIALTSLAGVVLFQEPVTRWMILGTGLTIGGLLLMERPREVATTGSDSSIDSPPASGRSS